MTTDGATAYWCLEEPAINQENHKHLASYWVHKPWVSHRHMGHSDTSSSAAIRFSSSLCRFSFPWTHSLRLNVMADTVSSLVLAFSSLVLAAVSCNCLTNCFWRCIKFPFICAQTCLKLEGHTWCNCKGIYTHMQCTCMCSAIMCTHVISYYTVYSVPLFEMNFLFFFIFSNVY